MVLQSNYAKRIVSNAENTPPSVLPTKSVASRFRSNLHDGRRRRQRTSGSSNPAKFIAEQAARRGRKPASLRFKMKSIPSPDVEMSDSTLTPPPTNTVPVMLPKELGRPEYVEVQRAALLAADPGLDNETPLSYIRDNLNAYGPQLLKTLSTVRASTASDALPKEIDITVDDITSALPSHMVAIFGPAPRPSASVPHPKRKVTLYPVHSLYLAAHCARLPHFPPTPTESPAVTPGSTSVTYNVPVRPLCLPSPMSYPRLSQYIYTKRSDTLLASLLPTLPTPPPASLLHVTVPEEEGTDSAPAFSKTESLADFTIFAHALAQTYTPQALLQHVSVVHGLWQNVCALGIFDDALWEVIDRAWRVLLCAISVGTGGTIGDVLNDAA
ncbi:hypothetical protein DXG03_001176 [Asterophora parasitica]|uniref:Clp1 n=1 Tax=Asterophora parasitica TaxID=117018 RepID=A0A9P7G599_9AGAR|nr:hypothetical protein DXG03_001176 [Asterophora parasitica]